MSFKMFEDMAHTITIATRPGSRLRKLGHNAVALFLVATLSIWQTPAVAFAAPQDDASPATEQVESTAGAAAGSNDTAAAESSDASVPGEFDTQAPVAPQKWEISFDANGGALVEGADESAIELIEDSGTAKLPEVIYQREGFEFAGWNTVANPADESVEAKDKLFVPAGAELHNLAYRYVVLTKDNATEDELKDATEASDGTKIAVLPADEEAIDAALEAGEAYEEYDASSRQIRVCDLRSLADDKGGLKLYAQWRAEKPATDDSDKAADQKANSDKDAIDKDAAADPADASPDASEKDEAANEKKDASKDASKGASKDANATENSASYIANDDVEAVDVQGKAAKKRANAQKALEALAEVDASEAEGMADELFALADEEPAEGEGGEGDDPADGGDPDSPDGPDDPADDPESAEPPRSGDGTNIEMIAVKWLTQDSVDNEDPALLYRKPAADEQQSVRLQINYALSGEHNYEPGDVTITIPAHMFETRAGKATGSITIPYPADPSTRADFNWKKVGDTYVLTNTKKMSAATKGYIQIAFSGMMPHDMVDMEESLPFDAYIQVTTHKGNTLALRSNALTAQFDTEAKLTDLNKRVSGSASRVSASSVNVPENLRERYADETEFIVVNWYVWGETNANTPYEMSQVDVIPGDKIVATTDDGQITEIDAQGFIVGATAEDGMEIDRGTVYTGYRDGVTGYYYYKTAYPASQFQPDTTYTFHNSVTATVTETDPEVTERTNPNVQETDPQLETTKSASTQTTWRYTNPKWEDPTGHFIVVKNGNDDHEQHGTAKNNISHKGSYTTSDTHMWAKSYQGWYGLYPAGMNDLRDLHDPDAADADQEGIRLSYTIDSVGYVMPWMFDSSTFNEYGATASRMSKNYSRPVTMVTEDTGFSIGRYGEKLTIHDDYDLVEIEFPDTPRVYYGKPKNINPDGSWTAMTAGDGTFLYASDSRKANWPDIELQIQRNGEWEHWATASWKSGSKIITLADGSTQTSGVVAVPADTDNFRTRVTLQNTSTDEQANECLQAAIDYDVRPVISLKSTAALKELIEQGFANSYLPELYIYNSVNMKAYDGSNSQIASINKEGYDVIRGYTTDTMVYPSKSSRQTISDVDYEEQIITIHYSAKVEERSFIPDRVTYEQAIEDGRLVAETHGFWRDLLPKGVTPDVKSVKLREHDKVLDAYTIEDYQGSGRTLLVVEAQLTPVPTMYRNNDNYYYEDVPSISFDAYYGFDEFLGYGNNIHNVISFESGNDIIGTIDGYRGEPDDPRGNGNVSTPRAFANDAEKDTMTDLDPDSDDPRFVYAGTVTRIDIISAGRVSLLKDVQVNNDGQWSSGIYSGYDSDSVDPSPGTPYETREEAREHEKELQDGGDKRTVYEGGQYAYRLRMISAPDTISSNLIVYDALETFEASNPDDDPIAEMQGHDPIDVDAPRWQGYFRSIDTSQLEGMGCAPVIYYSTIPNLQLSDETDPYSGHATNMDLTNAAVWTQASEYTGSLDDVKAIAVDARKKADGTDFALDELESATVVVRMQAPTGDLARKYIAEDAHSYNNAYLTGKTTDKTTGGSDDSAFVRKDYTKVGLREYGYAITKVWKDDNNRDGKRPPIVQRDLVVGYDPDTSQPIVEEGVDVYDLPFRLLRNGELVTDEEAAALGISNVTYIRVDTDTATFPNLPYTDPDGNKYRYSAAEDPLAEYTTTVNMDSTAATFTNAHTPNRISVSGEKQWVGDPEDGSTRPASISVKLFAQYWDAAANDGEGGYGEKVQLQSKTIKPDANGDWNYSFTNLYEYQDGHEIQYSVEEVITDAKGKSYVQGIDADGRTFVNTYHPFGDLSVSKAIEGATDASKDQEFTFDFSFEIQGTVIDEDTGQASQQWLPYPGADDVVEYDVLENGEVVSSGTLTADNHAVAIKGGQTIHVKDLPQGVRYQVAEEPVDGFTQTSSSGMSGAIQPNANTQARVTNTYSASASINLQAIKTLLNKDIKNNQFRYQLFSVADDGTETLIGNAANSAKDSTVERPDGTVESSTAPVVFGAINYTQDDHGKTFKYKMREVVPADAVNADGVAYAEATDAQKSAGGFKKNGYTYDGKECVVEVAVTDNGDGTLSVVPTYYAPQTHEALFGLITWEELAEGDATFENVYEAAGETTLRAWKDLQGRRAAEGEFTFDLYDQDGNIIQTKTNDATGTVTFDTFEYSQVDIGKTYYYAIHEQAGTDATVSYADAWYGYKVEVIDNEDGTLYPEQTMVTPVLAEGDDSADDGSGTVTFTEWKEEGAEAPIFVNTLNPGNLSIQKIVEDATPEVADTEFSFRVKLIGDLLPNWEPAGVKTSADGVEAELAFGDEDGQIPYSISASGESFQAEFEVALKGGESILLNDLPAGTAYQVFEDTPDGWLLETEGVSGTVEPLQTPAARFTNTYKPDITTAQFAGTKTLDGAAAEEGAFTFELVDENGEVLQSKPTLAGGFIQFDAIEYGKDDVGEHVYTIREADPNRDTIDWDCHEETVTVTVALDSTSGHPVSTVEYDNDGIVFANKTRPGNLKIHKATTEPVTDANKDDVFTFKVTLNNSKGMPLGEGDEIYWYVEDADGNPITQSAANQSQQEPNAASQQAADAGVNALAEGAGEPSSASEPQELSAAAPVGVMKSLSLPTRAAPTDDYSYILGIEPTTTQVRATGTLMNPNGGASTVKWTIYQDGVMVVEPIDGVSGTFTGGSSTTGTSPTGPMRAWPWFNYNQYITKVVFKGDVKVVGETVSMFRGEESGYYPLLEEIDFSGLDTSSVTRMRSMLYKLPALKRVNLWNFSTENIRTSTSDCMDWFLFEDPKLEVVIIGPEFKFVTTNNMTEPGNWKRVDNDEPANLIPWSSVISRTGDRLTGIWAKDGAEFDVHVGYVVFDGNGGVCTAPRAKGKTEDAAVTMPDGSTTTRLHHRLTGWNTEPDGSGTQYAPGESVVGLIVIDSSTTLYAQWEDTGERYYTVKHYQQNTSLNGYVLMDTDANQPGIMGQEVTPPTKTYEGFLSPAVQTKVVAEDDSTVIEYYYDRIKYNVVFDGNGATSGQMVTPQTMAYNVPQNLLPNQYQKKGSIFMGWNTEPDGSGTQFVDAQSVVNLSLTDGDTVTLYAQWFDNSDSALEPTAGVIYVQCKPGQTIVLPDLPDGTTYTVEEVDLPDGWSQEGDITSDSNTAVIEANVTKTSTATNAYTAAGDAELVAHKTLKNGELEPGAFTFELLDADKNVLQTATNGEVDTEKTVDVEDVGEVDNPWYQTALVTFSPIEYTQADIGEHTYYIREIAGADSSVAYDTAERQVTVTVSDAGHGLLATDVTYAGSTEPLFENKMKDAKLSISKEILNAAGHEDQEFSFKVELFDKDGNPLEGEFDAKKYTVDYKPEHREQMTKYSHTQNITDAGVKESNYANNWNNSNIRGTDRTSASSQAHVVSIPGAQTLNVTIEYGGESTSWDWACMWVGAWPDYTAYNNYGPSLTGKLGGTHGTRTYTVNGDTVTFSFRSDGSGIGDGYGYYAVVTGESIVPESGTEASKVSSGTTVTLKGGEHIDISGLPNGATYKVTEVDIPDNWTLAESEGDEGALQADKTSEAEFTDVHETPPDEPYTAQGTAKIQVNKQVEGGTLAESDGYTFKLTDADGNVLQEKGLDSFGAATSTVTFDDIAYSIDDVGEGGSKTFVYRVSEVKGQDESVTYDETLYTVWVTATDTGNGFISTDVQYVKYEDSTVEVGPGSAEATGGDVKIEMIAEPGGPEAGLALGDTVDYTIKVTNTGATDLSNVVVTDTLTGGSWTIETLPAQANAEGEEYMQSFGTSHVVTNTNVLSGKVANTASVSVGGGEAAACTVESQTEKAVIVDEPGAAGTSGTVTFKNKVNRTSVSLEKTWVDDGSVVNKRPGTITVELLANGRVLESQEVSADADGNWSYTFENLLDREGLEYSVREVPVEGYATETVYDEDAGVWRITNTRVPNTLLEFTKVLNGMDAQAANPRFSFTLVESDAEGNPILGGYTDTQANTKFAGNTSKVTFDLEDLKVGEHWYVVSEDAYESETISIDTMRYLVYVDVTQDAEDGAITVSEPVYYLMDEEGVLVNLDDAGEPVADEDPTFFNNSNEEVDFSSETDGYVEVVDGRVVVYPEVQKYLNGSTAALTGGDFEFTLTGTNGNGEAVEKTEPNDVTGKVAFYEKEDVDLDAEVPEALVFDKPGTYTFEIREVIPEGAADNGDGTFTLDDTTYDGSIITLTIEVTEADGVLSAETTYAGMKQGSDPAFYNLRETPSVEAAALYLSVDKYRAGTHSYLPGAELAVYDEAGNLVETWTTDGYVHKMTAGLEAGQTYTLVEESAPDGFDAVLDTEFTVAPDGSGIAITARESTTELVEADRLALYDPPVVKEKVVVRHKGGKSGTPATGDTMPTMALVLALAFMALAAFYFARRRSLVAPMGAHAGAVAVRSKPAHRGKHAR